VRRRWFAALLAIAVTVGAPVLAWGYWSAASAAGSQGAAVAASVNQGAAPTGTRSGATDVTVSWGASTLSDGRAVDGYVIARYAAGSGTVQTILTGCAGTVTATSCLEPGVPPGQWQYTVTPVIGTNWRGPESVKSGVVTIGAALLTLDTALLAAPLPRVITGSLAGFAPTEGVSYQLDAGTPLTGSPSSVGVDGSATISSLTIPSAPDGPHTVYAIGGVASLASAGIVIDTTAPTAAAALSPAPNGAGWNTTDVELALSANDGSGSGVAAIKYTTDGSDPVTSGSAQTYSTPVTISATATVDYVAIDDAGNASAVQSQPVSIDATAPVNALTLLPISGSAAKSGDTIYYRGLPGGSFRLTNALSDSGGSGPASSQTAALAGASTGWTHAASRVTTPAGGPYVSAPFSWTAGTTDSPTETVTGSDTADNAVATTLTYIDDSAPPAGGSVDATGLGGTGGRYSTSTTLSVDFTQGTDDGAGLATSGAQLLRASASLSSADGVADGGCGAYGAATQVGTDDPSSPIADTVPTDDQCYRYEYQVPDALGNVATYTSPDVKVETTVPASLAPTAATIAPLSGAAAQSVSGSTVYYNPTQSGSFTVDATASDVRSGVAAIAFPLVGGFSGGGSATSPYAGVTFRSTYSWSNNSASASPGQQALVATNGAGATATNRNAFSLVKDASGPNGGSVDATGLSGTGSRYSTSTTLSVAFTKGSDIGAGLAAGGAQLLRASASLSSTAGSDGSCGVYGPFSAVGAADPGSPKLDTVADHVCYRYQYVVPDQVGNATTYTSPDIKVDTTAPAAPTLAFSVLTNAFGSGSTVYYRPAAAAGAFTVTGTATDAYSGIASYAFPTFPAGWSSTAGALGVNTYSWSSPTPGAPGTQNVTATNNAGVTSAPRSFTLVSDNTAPATGTVGYTNGYFKTASVSVTFTKGTDGGSGLSTTSGLLQRASAPLAAGVCGSFGTFATIAANPPTSPRVDTTVSTGNCYQYQYVIFDNVGNQATYTNAAIAKVDTQPPVHALSLLSASGVVKVGTVLYYKGNAPGSFKLLDTVTDTASGPNFVTFPAITQAGWTHAAETINTPAGGPFTSSLYSWTTTPTNASTHTVTGQDVATNVGTSALTFNSDITAPSGGSVTYTNGVVNTLSVPVTTANGTDTKSGLNLTSGILQRDQTTLNTTTEACGVFPATWATTVTLTGGADTTVTSGSCFRYRYKISDNLGNQATYTSTSVSKVDTNGPRVTAIASKQSGGVTNGNGRLELGDRLILTFNQNLATASVPATFTAATESRTTGTVQLTIPGITSGALNTGNAAYLALTGTKSASFDGTVTLVNNATTATVTIIVTTLSGDATAISSGALVFQPAPTITDKGGNAAIGPFTSASTFKLF
jgi:hypothetical protein